MKHSLTGIRSRPYKKSNFFPPLSLTCPWPSIFFQAQVVSADEQEEDNVAAYTYMMLAVAFDLHWH